MRGRTKSGRRSGFTFRLFAQQTMAAANATLLEFLKEGALRPTISRGFPLSEAAEAVCHLIGHRSNLRPRRGRHLSTVGP
ncbi:zinc-binding dehydrogenase [Bradyrhizobium sp. UFLA05-109]